MFKKPLLAAAAIAASLVLLAGCSGTGGDTASTESDASFEASFAVDGFVLGAPVFVGLDKGYFDEENVKASTVTFQTGVEGIQALSSGQVDYAVGLDFATISSISENLVVVGAVASPDPGFHQIYFGQGIAKPSDLVGKKVGIIAGASQEYVTERWLSDNVPDGNVETVALPGVFELVNALKTGAVQAAFVFGPGIAQVKDDTSLTRYGDDSEQLTTQGIYLITTRANAEDNPDQVAAVLRSIQKGNEFIADDTDAAAQIVTTAVQGDIAAITASLSTSNAGLSFTQDQLDVLHSVQEFLIDAGKVPAGTNIDNSLMLDQLREIIGADRVATP